MIEVRDIRSVREDLSRHAFELDLTAFLRSTRRKVVYARQALNDPTAEEEAVYWIDEVQEGLDTLLEGLPDTVLEVGYVDFEEEDEREHHCLEAARRADKEERKAAGVLPKVVFLEQNPLT